MSPEYGGAPPKFEPSLISLDNMVQSFIEDHKEKQSYGGGAAAAAKHGRHRCNCFNGNSNDSYDEEFGFFSDSLIANSLISDPSYTLKSLRPCASMVEKKQSFESSSTTSLVSDCKTTPKVLGSAISGDCDE